MTDDEIDKELNNNMEEIENSMGLNFNVMTTQQLATLDNIP